MQIKNKNIVATIQARMGSSRLPGKVMLPLAGIPIIKIIHERVKQSRLVNMIVVATSENPKDDCLVEYCQDENLLVFRGSEDNVFSRVLECAEFCEADIIVEVTADCPLVDPFHIDILIDALGNNDYASNVLIRRWPDGFDIQVYTIDALRKCDKYYYPIREHVGWNIAMRTEAFKLIDACKPSIDNTHPEWGLTLDTAQDYLLLSKIFEEMKDKFGKEGILVSAEYLIEYLHQHPELLEINKEVKRNTVPKIQSYSYRLWKHWRIKR